jgi:hypothetical protein
MASIPLRPMAFVCTITHDETKSCVIKHGCSCASIAKKRSMMHDVFEAMLRCEMDVDLCGQETQRDPGASKPRVGGLRLSDVALCLSPSTLFELASTDCPFSLLIYLLCYNASTPTYRSFFLGGANRSGVRVATGRPDTRPTSL